MEQALLGVEKDLVWIFKPLFGKLFFMMWWMKFGWRAEILWPLIYIFSSDKLDHLQICLTILTEPQSRQNEVQKGEK